MKPFGDRKKLNDGMDSMNGPQVNRERNEHTLHTKVWLWSPSNDA